MKSNLKMRFKYKKGFTLAETLMAILILLMVTAIVAAGIPVAVNAYNKVVMSANAQLLLSTTITRLRDELGTATDISFADTDNKIIYKSDSGAINKIYLDGENGVYIQEYSDQSDAPEFTHQLVSEKAATENLYLTYTVENTCFNSTSHNLQSSVLILKNLTVKTKTDNKTLVEIEKFEIKILTYQA